jgi:hypothetical protein
MTNPLSRTKPVSYQQDPVFQVPSGTTRVPSNPVDPKVNLSDPNTRVQMQPQVQDSGFVLQHQFEQHQQHLQQTQQQHLQQTQQQHLQQTQQQQQQQQQFIHGTHYIHHPPTGALPLSAYYPVYPSQQQHHHPQHNPLEQQYPVYYMAARPAQGYSMPVQQSNMNEAASGVASNRSQIPPNPAMVPPPAAYNPIRNAPIAKHEMPAGVYRTATTGAPQLVQVPSTHHQQQYVGYSQMHHPSQSMAPTSAATAQQYAYEFADPAHAQIYYTQPLAPTMPSQYQTMTAASAVVLPEASAQLPTDNIKQQMRT